MPFEPALIFVIKTLVRYGICDKIRLIGSGKIISGYSILRAIALGADICRSA
jgi:glutamate synthase domain-containing protein 2